MKSFGHMAGETERGQAVDDAIQSNEVLSKLRRTAKEALAAGAKPEKLDRGKVVCHQGASAGRFWLLISGKIKLVNYTSKGAALLIDLVLPNQIFGTLFYDQNPIYPCTALTVQPSQLLSFRLKDLLADLDRNPALQKILLADTCRKLCQAQHMRGLGLEQAPVRLAHSLLHLHEKFGLIIPETRSTLAELAGMSVETAIRITRALAKRGILETRRGQMEIRSLAALRACAQGANTNYELNHTTVTAHSVRVTGNGRQSVARPFEQ